ncbi:Smr domain [Chlamydia trachomatis]|nr:Smr domain [Chlamydia trachomatis]CRH55258.1 Smr domain [Chlamydia trachomatis]
MGLYSFTIDLHGQTSEEAIVNVLNALFSLEQEEFYEFFDIIVGNGTGTLKFVVSDLLEEEGYLFDFINSNRSIIRVYRK